MVYVDGNLLYERVVDAISKLELICLFFIVKFVHVVKASNQNMLYVFNF